MKFTAPTAMPMPKTMPAKTRFDWPSPKANINPPTTIATRLSPVAIGPVKAVLRTLTALSHGCRPPARRQAPPEARRYRGEGAGGEVYWGRILGADRQIWFTRKFSCVCFLSFANDQLPGEGMW